MFNQFGSKGDKCMKASRMYSFEARRNPKASKDVRFNGVQNGNLGFLTFLDFDHLTQNFDFA